MSWELYVRKSSFARTREVSREDVIWTMDRHGRPGPGCNMKGKCVISLLA